MFVLLKIGCRRLFVQVELTLAQHELDLNGLQIRIYKQWMRYALELFSNESFNSLLLTLNCSGDWSANEGIDSDILFA